MCFSASKNTKSKDFFVSQVLASNHVKKRKKEIENIIILTLQLELPSSNTCCCTNSSQLVRHQCYYR